MANIEPLVTEGMKLISILGVGCYGKNIINNMHIPENSAELIFIEDSGEKSTAVAIAELKSNELLIIIADVSDCYTIKTLPAIIEIASIKNTLSLCFLLTPSGVPSSVCAEIDVCINKIQSFGGKVSIFKESQLLKSLYREKIIALAIYSAVDEEIKKSVQQLVKMLVPVCPLSIDPSDLQEIFNSSSRFAMEFTQSKNKAEFMTTAKRAPVNECGELVEFEKLSGVVLFVEADDGFTLGDYACFCESIEEIQSKSTRCIVGIYTCNEENFYGLTRINFF